MYEQRNEPLLSPRRFFRRLIHSGAIAMLVIVSSLLIGMLGYHYLAHLGWIDSFLNASMILSGMGPVDEIRGNAAKVFAGCYALFSGIVFLTTAAILFAPVAHRLLHRYHLSEQSSTSAAPKAPADSG